MTGIITITLSVITSALVTKALATHYFNIMDDHVGKMCEETKEFIEEVKAKLREIGCSI